MPSLTKTRGPSIPGTRIGSGDGRGGCGAAGSGGTGSNGSSGGACSNENGSGGSESGLTKDALHFSSLGALAAAPAGSRVMAAAPDPSEAHRKEQVRQETREQVPALTKMKATLNAYRLSFARMTSDALLVGWNPIFEYKLQRLCDEVGDLEDEEADLEAMYTADRDEDPSGTDRGRKDEDARDGGTGVQVPPQPGPILNRQYSLSSQEQGLDASSTSLSATEAADETATAWAGLGAVITPGIEDDCVSSPSSCASARGSDRGSDGCEGDSQELGQEAHHFGGDDLGTWRAQRSFPGLLGTA